MIGILGIDASLQGTGVVYDGPADRPIRKRLANKLKGTDRLIYIRDEFRSIIPEVVARSDGRVLAMIEGYAFNSRNGGERLGELGGVLRVELAEVGAEILEVSTTTLKVWTIGDGRPKGLKSGEVKNRILTEVSELVGEPMRSDDIADAMGLYTLGCELVGRRPHAFEEVATERARALNSLTDPFVV